VFRIGRAGTFDSKRTYAREVPKLREGAGWDAQYDLFQNGHFPVMVPDRRRGRGRQG